MKISFFVPLIKAEVLCGEAFLDREIKGGYAGDMLSCVMSSLQSGQAWFTILNSINVIAVASLTECSCVVLTESVEMESEVLRRASEKEIIILRTPFTTFDACVALSNIKQ
jgi:predicted transcriptional regulator